VRVLSIFFQKEGQAIPRVELLKTVWGYTTDTETRTLDNFIVRLRRYFEPDPGKPTHFQTVRGVGYRFSRKG
jgi:DNA-binding response OmpR family regulator